MTQDACSMYFLFQPKLYYFFFAVLNAHLPPTNKNAFQDGETQEKEEDRIAKVETSEKHLLRENHKF